MTEASVEVRDSSPPQPAPAYVPEHEAKIIDSVIMDMAAHVRRLNVQTEKILRLNDDHVASSLLDKVIATGFEKLRETKKIDDIADKLLERLMKLGDCPDDPGQSIGKLFIRYYDTMSYIVAWKGKFKGKPCDVGIDKEFAREQLRKRKLL